MEKRHIRPFNPKRMGTTATPGRFSQAIRAGNVIVFRGQTGQTFDGRFVGAGDPGAQARQACRNIRALVQEAGGRLEDVVKLTTYVTDVRYRPAVYAEITRAFKEAAPCSTGLVVTALARPEMLVEIDALAVVTEPQPHGPGVATPGRPSRARRKR